LGEVNRKVSKAAAVLAVLMACGLITVGCGGGDVGDFPADPPRANFKSCAWIEDATPHFTQMVYDCKVFEGHCYYDYLGSQGQGTWCQACESANNCPLSPTELEQQAFRKFLGQ
jgi:hypothetical protein